MFEKFLKFLTGDDFFISYSRRDDADYAANLANKLVNLKFSVCFGEWTTLAGKELPASPQEKAEAQRCARHNRD